VDSAQAMREALAKRTWDLVISDFKLPRFSGLEALAICQAHGKDVPFVLFSGTIGEEAAVAIMKAGAADYVHKDKPTRLVAVVDRELREATERRTRREAERRLTLERELYLRELEAANRELREADRHKDEFLGVVSHELRTPLTVVIGYADVLRRNVVGELSPSQLAAADHIATAAERLLALITDLLDYAQLQAGRFSPQCAATDVSELVEALERELAPRARARELEFNVNAEGHGLAWIDGQRTRTVIHQLATNALKFTGPGGRVDIWLRLVDGELAVEVQDTGVGISSADQARLFEGFRQVDMSDARSVGGLGLGLGLARAIVTALGGKIGVRSEPGQGSTFWFRLPASAPGAVSTSQEAPPCSPSSQPS
jgi:signal transduction histidine kinase